MTNFFRLFFRNLRRNKTFSIIAIAGFTLSLTIVLLLSAFVSYEASYDHFHANIDKLYRLLQKDGSCELNEDDITFLQNDYPEIEAVCRYNNPDGVITWNHQSLHLNSMLHTESNFFSMFDLEFIQGDATNALSTKDHILISDKTAKALFGTKNPIGELLTVNHELSLQVTAVYKSMPKNSSFQPEAIIHRDTKVTVSKSDINGKVTYYNRFVLLLKPNSNTIALQEKLSQDLQKHELEQKDLRLVPFKKSYMSVNLGHSDTHHSNLLLIIMLAGIALIIAIISALNYVILFTANNLSRLKEIALKKTIGARSQQIFVQFLLESIIICLISFIVAIATTQIVHPIFEKIVGKSFPLSSVWSGYTFAIILGTVLFIGLISGWLPSIIVSRISPLNLFRSGKSGRTLKVKSGLMTVQYTVSMILIISLVVISRQLSFVKNKDLGFDSEQLVRLDVHWRLTDMLPVLKQELLKSSNILDVTASHGGPGSIYYRTSWQDAYDAGWTDPIPVIHADLDFFNVFKQPVLIGRTFSHDEKENVVVINKTALEVVGWQSLEGRKINGFPVIGVVEDIHVEDMHRAIGPTFFIYDQDFKYSWLSLRIRQDDISGTIRSIEKTWKSICPEYTFNFHFYDEWIDAMYNNEEQLGYAIRLFATIAIIIACLGTFGVVQFTTNRRTKEIGIRKVNGAAVGEILKLLNWDFAKWITIAFCCAVPLGYFIMRMWLQNFAYRAPLSWWIFALSGIIALAIALLTVSWQTWQAARRNPVEALRYE